MSRKLLFLRSLFVALLLVCNLFVSVVTPGEAVYERNGNKGPNLRILSPGYPAHSLCYKIVPGRSNHIRVRYVGGDCGYHSSSLILRTGGAICDLIERACDLCAVTQTRSYFSLKLRGPPVQVTA